MSEYRITRKEYKIICKMFEMLARRASKSENNPRISTKNFKEQVGIAWESAWEIFYSLFEPIEKHCEDKNMKSLLALVVLPHDGLPTPNWLKKHNFKYSQTTREIESKYHQYLQNLQDEWKDTDPVAQTENFRQWLNEHYLVPEQTSTSENVARKFRDAETKLDTPTGDDQETLYKLIEQLLSEESASVPNNSWFGWPSTRVSHSAPRQPMRSADIDMPSDGVFSYFGYHVGDTRPIPRNERHAILEKIFSASHEELQQSNLEPQYLAEFGDAGSAKRLRKMANVLATLTKNLRRKQSPTGQDCSTAIADYESDLEYLRETYYVGVFGFNIKPMAPAKQNEQSKRTPPWQSDRENETHELVAEETEKSTPETEPEHVDEEPIQPKPTSNHGLKIAIAIAVIAAVIALTRWL